jgi:hypothetical protein
MGARSREGERSKLKRGEVRGGREGPGGREVERASVAAAC